ncbi:alternate-type signal peptide domain-containing protein [Arthrobacter jiangjiafuii]|uniref:Alternate-type signal peptide domain-containing protein n=1 Tax=Arthrobacter jiangjiafuii TaxID=2817475 RepID=A0A975R1Y9_9MICC|nr:alternate-type signal peptide domain-containing protein [Arthrobacter jiangjiafuii]QWC10969.1 alternate-type signal peptide domain-containing protein [Arthrobacter jiangjiafuii]
MAKGALAIGVGAALLLGGGGTLAVWNDSETTAAGQIASGELQLNPVVGGEGKWTNALGTVVDLDPTNAVADYRVVPGDVLTYTQKLDVRLAGDLMTAKLTMSTPSYTQGGFKSTDVTIEQPSIANAKGTVLPTTVLTEADSGIVTVSAKFTFNDLKDQGQSSMNAAAAFKAVTFKLDQQAPLTK